jgi:hypothetical protein
MAAFATLTQFKSHLKISTSDEDTDLQLKLDQAEAIILDYLGTSSPGNPRVVQAAILVQATELYRFRGDDPEGVSGPQTAGNLSPFVTNLLRRLKDPAFA